MLRPGDGAAVTLCVGLFRASPVSILVRRAIDRLALAALGKGLFYALGATAAGAAAALVVLLCMLTSGYGQWTTMGRFLYCVVLPTCLLYEPLLAALLFSSGGHYYSLRVLWGYVPCLVYGRRSLELMLASNFKLGEDYTEQCESSLYGLVNIERASLILDKNERALGRARGEREDEFRQRRQAASLYSDQHISIDR